MRSRGLALLARRLQSFVCGSSVFTQFSPDQIALKEKAMFTSLRGSACGAICTGLVGLSLIGIVGGSVAPAADPVVGPELTPPNPELTPPALPPAGAAAPAPAQPGEQGDQQGEALTRGAIHEAFAEPFDVNPTANNVVPRQPPEPINELPPDVKPDGDNVEWIPGYWGWDDERQDYIWISGLWRKIPPGRRWVPGYWVEADGGFRWVNGMWAEEQVQELNYLPAPPDSLEQGPNIAAPSDDYFWIPGCWMYGDTGYRWRAGYWSLGFNNWMWCPARYVWTPRGCFFRPGYWDYAFARRGVLFSPMFFGPGVWRRPAFAFSPTVALSIGGFSSHLFVGVGFGHYYFGDFYGDRWFRRGFQPWHVYHRRRFDPCLNYYAWYHRRNDRFDYVRRLENRHDHFVKHADQRPPHTYLAQRDWERRVGDARVDGVRVRDTGDLGRSLRDMQNRRDGDNNTRLVRVGDTQRREFEQHRTQFREISTERSRLERVANDGRGRDGDGRPGERGPNVGDRGPNVGDRGPNIGGRGPGSGEGRGPGAADTATRRGPDRADAAQRDSARLRLPETMGAEQRAAAAARQRQGASSVTRGDGITRSDGGNRSEVGNRANIEGRGNASGRSDIGNRGNASVRPEAGNRGNVGQPAQRGAGQPGVIRQGDSQPRVVQPREGGSRESGRTIQSRESQPRDSGRSFQPRESQPRDSGSRDSGRSFQPRDSGRSFQPQGGNSGSRDSQPRGGGSPRGGSSRDRGRSSVDAVPSLAGAAERAPSAVSRPREAVTPAPRQAVSRPVPQPNSRAPQSVENRARSWSDSVRREAGGSSSAGSIRRSFDSPSARSGPAPVRSRSSGAESRSSPSFSENRVVSPGRSFESSRGGSSRQFQASPGRSSSSAHSSRSGGSSSRSSATRGGSSRSGGRGR